MNYKEHLKFTGLYTFFAAFPALLQLVVYPVIEGNDRLDAVQFGYLAIAEAVLSFLVMYILFGMAITISRFYFDVRNNKEQYKKLISTIFTGILLRGFILLAGILILMPVITGAFSSDALNKVSEFGHHLVIIAFSRTVMMVALALYRNEKRIRIFILFSVLSGLCRSIFQVTGVLWFDMSFAGYLAGTAIGSGIIAVLVIVKVYTECGIHYSYAVRKTLTRYAFPLFLTDMVFWGIMFIDRFFLISDTAALGIYDNAMKFAVGIQFISQGLASSVQPELYRLYSGRDGETMNAIKTQTSLYMAENIVATIGLLIPVMFFISYFYETSLVLSATLLPLIFARFLLYAQYQAFLWPILYLKRPALFLYVSLAAFLLVFSFSFYLVPRFSYMGAIAASLVANGFQVVMFRIIQQRLMPIPWNNIKIFWFPLMVVVFTIAMELVKHFFSFNMYLAAFLLLVFSIGGLMVIYRREFSSLLRKYFQ